MFCDFLRPIDSRVYEEAKDRNKVAKQLEDANDAGTKNSESCTLILTEGDSAKSLAVAELGVIGRN